jgi:histidyl-tRNA synthetase
VEAKARQVFISYNFAEIRIPILEKTELFSRSIGETTDIVEKEMYTFEDRDARGADGTAGTKLTLRPEGTAGVVRAYVEAEMYKVEPVRKLYYMGAMFRRERPQKGRMRQFHQIGAEALGRGDPFIDAEILLLLHDFFSAVGVTEPSLQINSSAFECRPVSEKLLGFKQANRFGNCRGASSAMAARLDCKGGLHRATQTRRRFSILCAALAVIISPPCSACSMKLR